MAEAGSDKAQPEAAAAGGAPATATDPVMDRTGQPPPPAPKAAQPKKGTKALKYIQDKVHVWPHLTRLEMMSAIAATLVLTVWAITIDAPLEEPANVAKTPNPSKAPWYFLGLQEMLVYFDPWIAGVVMPTLIVVGLMVIPYVDPNPKGNGYYTFKERWFAISTFLFGFLVLWISLIVVGTFLRGPGWNIFMPWQEWDPHLVVPLNNVDLNQFIAMAPSWLGMSPEGGFFMAWKSFFENQVVAAVLGLGLISIFFGLGTFYFGRIVGLQSRIWHRFWKHPRKVMTLGMVSGAVALAAAFLVDFPVVLGNVFVALTVFTAVFVVGALVMDRTDPDAESLKVFSDRFMRLMGPMRLYTVGLLYTSMLGLIVKMALRQMFNIKYIVQIPWINANI